MRTDNMRPRLKVYDFIEKYYYILIIIVLVIALFNLFYKLGDTPINSWDEARHGVNAYEMIKRDNYIVNTYNYKIDYWNLKPPASYWAIILGYRIFGFNALGLRFFSALAALVTIISVCLFVLNKNGKIASLISTLALSTTLPYITDHCARTGDADSIYVLFFTLSIISIMMVEKDIRWMYLSGLFFSFSFLAKSWHTGNIIIICSIYLFYLRKILKIRRTEIIKLLLGISIPILLWMFLRYHEDGMKFIKDMISYDLAARTSRTLEGHTGTRFYYIEALREWYFYWILVFTVAVTGRLVQFIYENKHDKYPVHWFCLTLWIIVPFILYTIARTKIWWYILPIYPAAAIIIGLASDKLIKSNNINSLIKIIILFLIIIAAYKNEATIIERISISKPDIAQELIKETVKTNKFEGRHIYVDCYEQSYVLCAELYGNLIPCDGGSEGFIKDTSKSPLLIIPKDRQLLESSYIEKIKIISENSKIYIFTK